MKNHEKYFLFHLNKLNLLLAIQVLLILCIFIKANLWYLWSLKILAIKRWFVFNFAKILLGRHFVVGGPKNFKCLADIFFWERLSKYCPSREVKVLSVLIKSSWKTEIELFPLWALFYMETRICLKYFVNDCRFI